MKGQGKPLFLYVIGPTASGKSDFALQVAQELQWPIVNCDSLQVYRKVNIGTAKPTLAEMKSVPHYLFDFVEPPETLTAADYLEEVKKNQEHLKHSPRLFVGGSGFYVQALEKGLYPNSNVADSVKEKVSLWLEEEGYEGLYNWIQQKDLQFAQSISLNDHYRVRRAVEVMLSQDKNMTDLKKEMEQGTFSILPEHQSYKIAFKADKVKWRDRVTQRTRKMLSLGFVDEVKSLLDLGLEEWPPLKSVGYKEIGLFLKGEIVQDDLEERIVTSTMQLIKKQMTWFKRDQSIVWFDISEQEKAFEYIKSKITE